MSPLQNDLLDGENIWGEVSGYMPTNITRGRRREKQTHQMKENNHQGELLESTKEENCLRLYFQNINGGIKECDWGKLRLAMEKLIEMNVDIFDFAETNLAWSPEDRNRARRILTDISASQSKCEMSASNEPSVSSSQPGGTMIGVMGNHVGRVLEAESDESGLGRWSWVCLDGKQTKLYVISAYRVQQENSDGINTTYTQQKKILRMKGHKDTNPRKQWITDLTSKINRWKNDGEIMLMTDINSPLGSEEVGNFLADTNMIDLIGYKYGLSNINSHITGSQQIDFIFGTKKLAETIQKAGILPFHQYITADHRAMYIDINYKLLFIGEIHAGEQNKQRQVCCKHRKRSEEFKQKVTQKMTERNIPERSKALITRAQEERSTQIIEEMEQIDQDISITLEEAENELKQFPRYWWSKTLHTAHQLVDYWKTVMSYRRNNMEEDHILQEKAIEIGPEIDIYQGNKERSPKAQLRKALKERKKCQNNSFKLRQEFLEKLAEEEADYDPHNSKATILRSMKQREATTRTYKIMRRYLKPDKDGCCNFIEVPDIEKFRTLTQQTITHYQRTGEEQKCAIVIMLFYIMMDERNEVTKFLPHRRAATQEDMENNLIDHFGLHFNQAHPTPCAQPPLDEQIGFTGEGPLAQALKNGTANLQQLQVDEYTTDVLAEMQWNEECPPKISESLTWRDIQHGFKIWNEKTSTSPLGRHLGKYKVWLLKEKKIEEAKREKDQQKEAEEEKPIMSGKQFFSVIKNILRTAILQMSPMKRWLTVHNLFILKESGNHKISRSRTLHKLDAELNLMRRTYIAHRSTQQAERFNHLNDDQYGGRKGRSAIDPVGITTLMREIFHTQRSNACYTDCDAKACYDRIHPGFASICKTNASVPENISTLCACTLRNMEYHMCTAKGVSARKFSNSMEKLAYGVGQGATDAGTKWIYTENIITRAYNKKAIGCRVTDPKEEIQHKQNAVTFVDDKTLLHAPGTTGYRLLGKILMGIRRTTGIR